MRIFGYPLFLEILIWAKPPQPPTQRLLALFENDKILHDLMQKMSHFKELQEMLIWGAQIKAHMRVSKNRSLLCRYAIRIKISLNLQFQIRKWSKLVSIITRRNRHEIRRALKHFPLRTPRYGGSILGAIGAIRAGKAAAAAAAAAFFLEVRG